VTGTDVCYNKWANTATGVLSVRACATGMLFVRVFLGLRDLDARLAVGARYDTLDEEAVKSSANLVARLQE
jgi:hypothetical protein